MFEEWWGGHCDWHVMSKQDKIWSKRLTEPHILEGPVGHFKELGPLMAVKCGGSGAGGGRQGGTEQRSSTM